MSFAELGLSEAALKGVEEAGYQTPTPIQAQAIPAVLEGNDVIGASQTGTGKTAAFALPILSKIPADKKVRCLILEPVRELAAQVQENFEILGKHTGVESVLVHGGVGYGKQTDALKAGVEVVIATPGRLLDHMGKGTINLRDLDFLVLDEVDRMLDMGFLPDVRRIVEKCPKTRKTLFFSATMPPQIQGLADWVLKNPVEIEIGRRQSAAETVSHAFYPVTQEQREELFFEILKRTDFKSVMVFTRTKAQADKLFRLVKKKGDYHVTVMHSDIKQSDRAKALKGFKDGTFDVIIATDVAARGIDVSGVTHVINFQVPENPEDYVHRIGRTGRAQAEGDAFTILAADELPFADAIEKMIGQKIERRKLDDFKYNYTTLLDNNAPTQDRLNRMLGRRQKMGGRRRGRR